MLTKIKWLLAIAVLMLGLSSCFANQAQSDPIQPVSQSPGTPSVLSPSPVAQASPSSRVSTSAAPPSLPNAANIFDSLQSQLQQRGIPLKLPTYIPVRGQTQPRAGGKSLPVYANLTKSTPTLKGYDIVLGYTPDCAGGNACRLGTVRGEMKPQRSIEQVYASARNPDFKGKKSKEPMEKVALVNGLEGWFIPWVCGANCSDAKVVWDDGDYRYSVGIKVGDKASLVKMANSSIENKK